MSLPCMRSAGSALQAMRSALDTLRHADACLYAEHYAVGPDSLVRQIVTPSVGAQAKR